MGTDHQLDGSSFQTRALNVPVRDGEVTRAELLLTPDADVNGLPACPEILYTRDMEPSESPMVVTELDFS